MLSPHWVESHHQPSNPQNGKLSFHLAVKILIRILSLIIQPHLFQMSPLPVILIPNLEFSTGMDIQLVPCGLSYDLRMNPNHPPLIMILIRILIRFKTSFTVYDLYPLVIRILTFCVQLLLISLRISYGSGI